MITLKNTAKGPRAVLLTSGGYEFFQPGEQRTIEGGRIRSIPADLIEITRAAQPVDQDLPEQPAGLDQQATGGNLAQLDRDGDGQPGGSLPHNPPALAEMTRIELQAHAVSEGIDLDRLTGTGKNGALVMADTRKAIEAKRAGNAA